MSIQFSAGASEDVEERDALDEALQQARAGLSGPPKGALLYVSTSYDAQRLLDLLAERLPGVPLVGCTASGILTERGHHADDAILLVLFGGDISCAAFVGQGASQDGYTVGHATAARALEAQPNTRLILVHPEGVGVDGSAIVRGVQAGAPGVVVVGGCASETSTLSSTRQFFGRELLQDAVPLLAIAGDFEVGVAKGCGWKPVGRRMKVTKATGRAVQQVDGKPTREVLREYTGMTSMAAMAETPFAVFPTPGQPDFYLRAAERMDDATGELLFLAEVPEGAEIQLTMATPDQVLDGADESALASLAAYPGQRPSGALVVSCAARKWLLSSRVQEEAQRHGARLGGVAAGVPVVGFYSHGEIAPLPQRGSEFHNQTCVTLLIGE